MHFLPDSYIGQGAVDYTSAGTWDDWMYAIRHSIPMTVEVYGNPNIVPLYQDHLVSTIYEFKNIKGYFNPPEVAIDRLSNTIHPLNIYWLRIAPALNLTVSPHFISIIEGNTFGISIKYQNIGLRLNTTDIPNLKLDIPQGISLLSGMPYQKVLQPMESISDALQFRALKPGIYYLNITIRSNWAGVDAVTIRIDCHVYVQDYSLLIGISLLGAASAVLIIGYLMLRKH